MNISERLAKRMGVPVTTQKDQVVSMIGTKYAQTSNDYDIPDALREAYDIGQESVYKLPRKFIVKVDEGTMIWMIEVCECKDRRGPVGGICGHCSGAIPDQKEGIRK